VHKGIYIKKVMVLGANKEHAEILLDKGLNVLSGASNTGKSYVFSCIDFILGAGTSPKNIEEAEGYREVRAEIGTYDGKVYSLSRLFNDTKILMAECSLDKFNSNNTRKLSATHSAKNDENISSFLLELIGLKGKKLKKNNINEKKEISFRDIARFCLIGEEKIITETSPIYTGQHTSTTQEDSLFRLILSGKDDDELETFDDPKLMKSKIHGKIEYIKTIIDKKSKKLSQIKETVKELQSNELNIQIEELSNFVDKANQEVIQEEEKRQKIWLEMDELNSHITQIKELKKRFSLLDQHYTSDLGRLDFINEGNQLVEQLKDVDCPICGKLMHNKILEQYDANFDEIQESLKSEFIKIRKKQDDLKKTVETLNEEEQDLLNKFDIKKKTFESVDAYILSKLKPVYNVNKEKLMQFLKLKEEEAQITTISNEIDEDEKELKYYENKLNEKEKRASQITLSDDIYQGLANDIKTTLCSWGLTCNHVYYLKNENDIEIDGKSRKNFGKGFRAIYLSAFMIAVMQYCIKNDLNHPYFLILDSPLTSYKEKDKEVSNNDDKLSEEVQEKFFKSISKIKEINKFQIFVIDNKEPTEKLTMNSIHFSGNEHLGRYGFFPIKRN
jgi:DNA repair ATPase RecN